MGESDLGSVVERYLASNAAVEAAETGVKNVGREYAQHIVNLASSISEDLLENNDLRLIPVYSQLLEKVYDNLGNPKLYSVLERAVKGLKSAVEKKQSSEPESLPVVAVRKGRYVHDELIGYGEREISMAEAVKIIRKTEEEYGIPKELQASYAAYANRIRNLAKPGRKGKKIRTSKIQGKKEVRVNRHDLRMMMPWIANDIVVEE